MELVVWHSEHLLTTVVQWFKDLWLMLVYIIVMLSADLLSIQAHTPSPEPKQYEKKQWDWYNQDDMVIRDGPQGKV